MSDYKLPYFVSSRTWVKHFRDKNKLSLRVPHYEKRVQINKDMMVIYIKQIEDAIEKYGIDPIINMDKTFVRTHNLPIGVVARRGQNGVKEIRPKSCNTKEGTIFIASVSICNKNALQLVLVAKGKISRCEKKLYIGVTSRDLITHSPSG